MVLRLGQVWRSPGSGAAPSLTLTCLPHRALEVRELMMAHSPKPGHQRGAGPGFQPGAAPATGLGVTDGGLGQSGEGAPTHTPVPLRDVTVPPLGRLLLHGAQGIPKGQTHRDPRPAHHPLLASQGLSNYWV